MHREREKDNFKIREGKCLNECALALRVENNISLTLFASLSIVYIIWLFSISGNRCTAECPFGN